MKEELDDQRTFSDPKLFSSKETANNEVLATIFLAGNNFGGVLIGVTCRFGED